MKLVYSRGTLVIVAAAAAAAALAIFALTKQDEDEGLRTAGTQTELGVSKAQPAASRVADIVPQFIPSCDGAAPFGSPSSKCAPSPDPSFNGGAEAISGSAGEMPAFKNVQVIGGLGGGGAATALLQSAGRSLAGTEANHDAVLIKFSDGTDPEVDNSITKAIESGKFVIIDGKDTLEGSSKLNKSMMNRKLLSIDGVSSYGVVKDPNGRLQITPLQSVADAKGVRRIDQIHDVLGIEKPEISPISK